MDRSSDLTIPYPPIERHAVIGDRRVAALVAADGTIDWFCAPRYDADPVFGALLDAERGGACRFGPRARLFGTQRYPRVAPIVETRFVVPGGCLTLTDAMIDPEHPRAEGEGRRTIVRRLEASADGSVPIACTLLVEPREHARARLRVWSDHDRDLVLRPGEVAWAVLAFDDDRAWSAERARASLDATNRWWERRCERLTYGGERRARVLRSLVTIELLGDATTGASVAAPTTSLPERIGGDWNADYRLAWVRDGSLAAATLARAGDEQAGRRYFDWLTELPPASHAPLQVLYRTDGAARTDPAERDDFDGYRRSRPVRFGNHASGQKQLGIYGFLADCAHIYRAHGGRLERAHFELVARGADHVAEHWREADNGIWELPERREHVASRVMSWLALERAARIADDLSLDARAPRWRRVMTEVVSDIVTNGWSPRRSSFVQTNGSDALDASLLLVPITGVVPPDDPRSRSTVEAIERELGMNGWIHRFDPSSVAGITRRPLGEYEGAFVLCTAWLASAWAILGEPERAARILDRIDAAASDLGLLPEGIDARSGAFLGNFPLLFSHAEYVRAVIQLERAVGERPSRR